MFEKLLSVLPYNPSLVHQMSFYSARMREEAAIRRIGMIFILLAFLVQFFAVISPPKPTYAEDTNNMSNNPIASASRGEQVCLTNQRHYREIIEYYGLTCADIGNATSLTIHSTGQMYYSIGHNPYGDPNRTTGKTSNEGRVHINDFDAYYRLLRSWDTGGASAYEDTLRVRSAKTNEVFYILKNCGNLVSVHPPKRYIPPTPPPAPKPTPAPTPKPTPAPTPTPTPTPVTPVVPTPVPPVVPPTPPKPTPPKPEPCIYGKTCKPCDKSTNNEDTLSCVSISKRAANVTQNIADANNTMAKAGDVVLYTLYAQNNGKASVTGYKFKENMNDVLQYSNITNYYGGIVDSDNIVNWPKVNIASGAIGTVQIAVKVKDPIPTTPLNPGNPDGFNLVMTNVYGNAINVKLPSPPVKTIETTTTQKLPNTGPGESLAAAAIIVMVSAYFYSRSRLLAHESNLAIQEVAGA